MVFQANTPEPVLCEPPPTDFPEVAGYSSEGVEVGAEERAALPADTEVLRRRYTGEAGELFTVTLVVSGRSKRSIHRPELCMPAQGYQMSRPRTAAAGGVDWRLVTLDRGGAGSVTLAYTFRNQADVRTCSHLRRIFTDVWDRSVRGRIDRWVMAEVSATGADDGAMLRFLAGLKGVVGG